MEIMRRPKGCCYIVLFVDPPKLNAWLERLACQAGAVEINSGWRFFIIA
jgi:hypothetical protein